MPTSKMKEALTTARIERQWIKDIQNLIRNLQDELQWAKTSPELSGTVAFECMHMMRNVSASYFKYRAEEVAKLNEKVRQAKAVAAKKAKAAKAKTPAKKPVRKAKA